MRKPAHALLLAAPAKVETPERKGFFGLIPPARLHEAIPQTSADAPRAGFLLAALAKTLKAPGAPLLWVREAEVGGEGGELYAPGFAQLGLSLADLILVRARKRADALWAAEQGLKREGALTLLELGARGRDIDLTATRRLALAAESNGATALMMRGDLAGASAPSAAWTRWSIARAPARCAHANEIGPLSMTASLIRDRGGAHHARFFLEWSEDEHALRAEALGGDLAEAFAGGPARAPRLRRA
ncbi:MAG: ImuA family protein [Hyphomonadaceae bacterium]